VRLGHNYLPFIFSFNTIHKYKFSVAIAKRKHPFPSRTRKLSSSAPMVLRGGLRGRVGRRRDFFKPLVDNNKGLFILPLLP
jgi:hypothetical protein